MKRINKLKHLGFLTLIFSLIFQTAVFAQLDNPQGNAGIISAADQVKGFFGSGVQLMYAIGAIVGLVGAVKVFNKWNSGDPDTGKVAAAWFGSCVFLVVVAIVLQSFFGGNVGP